MEEVVEPSTKYPKIETVPKVTPLADRLVQRVEGVARLPDRPYPRLIFLVCGSRGQDFQHLYDTLERSQTTYSGAFACIDLFDSVRQVAHNIAHVQAYPELTPSQAAQHSCTPVCNQSLIQWSALAELMTHASFPLNVHILSAAERYKVLPPRVRVVFITGIETIEQYGLVQTQFVRHVLTRSVLFTGDQPPADNNTRTQWRTIIDPIEPSTTTTTTLCDEINANFLAYVEQSLFKTMRCA